MIGSTHASALLHALLEALESAELGCTVIIDRGDRLERAYANAPFAKIVGLDLEAARRIPPMDVLPTKTERERLAALRAEIGTEHPGPRAIETVITRADGSSVPVAVRLGYADIDGARATFVFMRDISATASMAAALRESEERFRRVAESSADSITVTSGGKYIYANPVALRILGLTSIDELPNVDPWASVPPERRAEIMRVVERMTESDPTAIISHRILGPDGKDTFLESSLSLTSMGGTPALVSYTRDITERVSLHAELMNQDRLANVGFLAAGVAHELSNPLTSLAMQARKLLADAERHGLSAEVKNGLGQIDEAAQRMNAIIADLLFMARPAEQPQAHVDVAQILTSTIALVRAGVPDCPHVHVEIAELAPIQGWASKLGQVFFNVIRNAVQAVQAKRSGEVRVRARLVDETIEIVVTDDGVGIPAEVVPRVTQPFFTTKPQGTGLGLWISQTLMAHHKGTLDLRSTEGAGTTVTLRLPTS